MLMGKPIANYVNIYGKGLIGPSGNAIYYERAHPETFSRDNYCPSPTPLSALQIFKEQLPDGMLF